jgi:hypothetical protein
VTRRWQATFHLLRQKNGSVEPLCALSAQVATDSFGIHPHDLLLGGLEEVFEGLPVRGQARRAVAWVLVRSHSYSNRIDAAPRGAQGNGPNWGLNDMSLAFCAVKRRLREPKQRLPLSAD